MNKVRQALLFGAALAMASAPMAALAQQEPESVGRGWPVPVMEAEYVGSGGALGSEGTINTRDGEIPEGITPLPRDMFNTDDFYADRELWSDPRYFRCNSPQALEAMWGSFAAQSPALTGDNPPETIAWGFCGRDYPREAIVSPYPFKTAKEHYEALLAETTARGGPTQHTRETLPDWDGRYVPNSTVHAFQFFNASAYQYTKANYEPPQWLNMVHNQVPTVLSLLTPEYQTRAVQMYYHEGANNAHQWPASYCWPEGFLRFWSPFAWLTMDVTVNEDRVQFLASTSDNFVRHVAIGGQFDESGSVPFLSADTRQWYGETIGFWDEDTLITWTSNVQGWTAHGVFEFSDDMQAIEIWSPRRDEDGNFVGLEQETIFYDPTAFVEPLRAIRYHGFEGKLSEVGPFQFVDCIQTLFPVDGRAEPVTPGTVMEYRVPDMYNRPWAQVWEEEFEQGMQRPEEEQLFGF